MLKQRLLVFIVILSFLMGACQGNQPPASPEMPGAYPYPVEGGAPAGQETDYPLSEEMPVSQETPYPPPETGGSGSVLPVEPLYGVQPGDANLEVGSVFLNLAESDILLLESYPVQVKLVLRGDLPTPCNQLRVKVSEPDAQNRIQVEVYSVIDPNVICIQVIQPFETQITLGSFTSGKFTVYVNGEYLGEFTL